SSGGHNGLASVIAAVGPDFPRLRVGIGRPSAPEELIDYVLGCFSPEERELLPAITRRAAQAVVAWCAEGIEKAMSKFNGPVPLE
ncbi:MAG: aminoacyl-tRNA hydrolase, partial [Firmicutes bacterium]|nr:aminoacyl-tRNA hydrolase [Bacillota bacterium]